MQAALRYSNQIAVFIAALVFCRNGFTDEPQSFNTRFSTLSRLMSIRNLDKSANFENGLILGAEMGYFDWAEESYFESVSNDRVGGWAAATCAANIFEIEYRNGRRARALRFLKRVKLDFNDLRYLVRYVALHALEEGHKKEDFEELNDFIHDPATVLLLKLKAAEISLAEGKQLEKATVSDLIEQARKIDHNEVEVWSSACSLALRVDKAMGTKLLSDLQMDEMQCNIILLDVVDNLLTLEQASLALTVLKEMSPGDHRWRACCNYLCSVLSTAISDDAHITRELMALMSYTEYERMILAGIAFSFGRLHLGDLFLSQMETRDLVIESLLRKTEHLIEAGDLAQAQELLKSILEKSSDAHYSEEWSALDRSAVLLDVALAYGKLGNREQSRVCLRLSASINEKSNVSDGTMFSRFGSDGIWMRFSEVAYELGETEEFNVGWERVIRATQRSGRQSWGKTMERSHEVLSRLTILAMKSKGIDHALRLVLNSQNRIHAGVLDPLSKVYGRSALEIRFIFPPNCFTSKSQQVHFAETALCEFAKSSPGIIRFPRRGDLRLPSGE